MTQLNSAIELAETAERYEVFSIIEACKKMRKLGEGSYSKMVLTGGLDLFDYWVGFINFEIFHCYQAMDNQHYSRIWFATIDDGDMGAWIPLPSKEEAIKFNDNFAEKFLRNLNAFPTRDELNKQLVPFGVYIAME